MYYENLEKMRSPQEISKDVRESIYKAKKQIEKQADNLKELFTLIRKHPDLPIVPMVDAELVGEDSGRWLGSLGQAYIDKFLHYDGEYLTYDKGDPDIVSIFEKIFDYEECGIDEEMPDEEALPIMREKVDSLPWIEAIIVNVDTPEPEMCRDYAEWR